VLDANPLENIRNSTSIRYVMKNGELFEAATLDRVGRRRKFPAILGAGCEDLEALRRREH
jgi:hypothetical protein